MQGTLPGILLVEQRLQHCLRDCLARLAFQSNMRKLFLQQAFIFDLLLILEFI
jgi:hypothetical protein